MARKKEENARRDGYRGVISPLHTDKLDQVLDLFELELSRADGLEFCVDTVHSWILESIENGIGIDSPGSTDPASSVGEDEDLIG